MKRSYYSEDFEKFLKNPDDQILGELTKNHKFELDIKQKNAWQEQIRILKKIIANFKIGYISFEFEIPRMGKRIDNILIIDGVIFIIEFKIGESSFRRIDKIQVEDYCLDLKNFHKGSHDKIIVPLLVITNNDKNISKDYKKAKDNIYGSINTNPKDLEEIILFITKEENAQKFDYKNWESLPYEPTPTIIEAAKQLYASHGVENINKSEGDRENLKATRDSVIEIIRNSKKNKKKSICFITGVPGAGKTLAGLDIIRDLTSSDKDIRSVYLSGNLPLVTVLRESLARDKVSREKIRKSEAEREVKQFIQPIHHFRKEQINSTNEPNEKVIIFDEAQRCWTEKKLNKYLKEKEGLDIKKSEPEVLIEAMNRHEDWCVLICLVGGGQEIFNGEGGVVEWFNAIKNKFAHWQMYFPKSIISMPEYNWDNKLDKLIEDNSNFFENNNLHLNVSRRSFRAEKVSLLVESILNLDIKSAQSLLKEINDKYPILLTRDLNIAKNWIKNKKRGSERFGLLGSSGAKRLKTVGISVEDKPDIKSYFLDDEEKDFRSSNFLEKVATEFDVQGLELDWSIVGWDYDFSYQEGKWEHKRLRGSDWQNINNPEDRLYKKNTYRVLLTRARQGMIIFVPNGDDEDYSRQKLFYDGTFDLLNQIGIKEI